ncbi:MAG: tetratricopeptide repeat protein, partial [Maribacter sp.]|nr:tetratricopeptide repeat protein [Maribacter sp.]
ENINFYGDNRPVTLPNTKINALLSFAWWQDKPQWENGPWLAPQIATGMTFEQYRTNQDPALEAALSFSDANFITDPMAHFTNLFTTGKVDQIKPDAIKMLGNPYYQFFDFEAEFNRVGYRLMNDGQVGPAVFVLQLLTELFPASANAWDSAAEAYWKAGDTAKATSYYNKAIELDPNGETGAHAKEMLKQLENEPLKEK